MSPQSTAVDWHRLDHNANIYTVISSKKLSNVYRVSAILKEDINPELLQEALVKTLPYFHAFSVRLKKGLFWNYFEENKQKPKIEEEINFPCQYMDPYQNNLFLFRVSYYKKRINLEVFHALTDGTGAIRFLLAICYQYIKLLYPENFSTKELQEIHGISYASNTEDSYIKNYVPSKKETYDAAKALTIKGERFPLDANGIIHGNVPVHQIKKISKEKKCSVTQYLCATMCFAIYTEKLNKIPPKRPIGMFVPVNLRNYFGSTTSLNFFSGITVNVAFKDKDVYEFDDVLNEVQREFEKKLTKESMLSKISYIVGDGYSIPARIAPLPLKALVLKFIYLKNKKSNTITLTNLGPIDVLPKFKEYFEKFSFLLSATQKECIKSSVVSFEDNLVFTFSSTFAKPDIQKAFFRKLASDGLDVMIESNGAYNETM